jgi:hypothetical protein
MTLPTIPQITLVKWAGVLLLFGMVYSYGYFKGHESQSKATDRALNKLLESEKALARVASQLATQASQRVTQQAERATTIRREYSEAKPSDIDPVNCVSPDQRRLLMEASRSPTQPGL